jgi:histidine phosphotransferase ChpT
VFAALEPAPRAAAAWLVHLLVDEAGGEVQVADGGEENMLLLGVALPG